jgi:hypothetical protein
LKANYLMLLPALLAGSLSAAAVRAEETGDQLREALRRELIQDLRMNVRAMTLDAIETARRMAAAEPPAAPPLLYARSDDAGSGSTAGRSRPRTDVQSPAARDGEQTM